jgi:hypothetical protein
LSCHRRSEADNGERPQARRHRIRGAVPLLRLAKLAGVPMRIFSEQRGGYLVLTFEGRLDPLTAPAIQRRMLVVLAEYQQGLVCDVAGLRVAEPLTLTLFRGVGTQAMYWPGTPVVLCRADAAIRAWVHRLGIDEVVPVRATLAAALSAPRYQLPVTGDVLRLPPRDAAARAAREFVRTACQGYSAETVETAVLLVNELVSHAVRDAKIELCVLLSLRGPAIRIAVTDDNPQLLEAGPLPLLGDAPPASRESVPGLDLTMLDALADRWGVLPTGSGKLVWCLLQD